jgi:hypothetical protein
MADPGPITAYLAQLRFAVTRLPDAEAHDLVAETEDHLRTVADRLVATTGCTIPHAEAQALARFGSAALVARLHLEERKRGGAVRSPPERSPFVLGQLSLPPPRQRRGQAAEHNQASQ